MIIIYFVQIQTKAEVGDRWGTMSMQYAMQSKAKARVVGEERRTMETEKRREEGLID